MPVRAEHSAREHGDEQSRLHRTQPIAEPVLIRCERQRLYRWVGGVARVEGCIRCQRLRRGLIPRNVVPVRAAVGAADLGPPARVLREARRTLLGHHAPRRRKLAG